MNNSPHNVFQRYFAKGSVIMKVEAPSQHEPAVARQLRSPGMMTLVPRLNIKKFVAALVNEGIKREDAQTVAKSIVIIEDAAYFVPKEYEL
jgi:hypothetical protein